MSLLRIASLCALVVAAAACSSGDRRPQKEHTFTGNLTDAQRAQAGHNKRVRDRIEAEESAALYKRLDVKIAKLDSNAPYAGLGFLPNNSVGYVVQRDSQAALFTYKGTLTKLDRLVKRVDHAELAGPGSNRILGLSAHGSQAAWNAGNLTQQIILRPQKTTFDRVKMFDSQPVSQGSYLVTASEGGLLETWSLASGNRMRAVRFANFQPRQIGRNISVNRVIFGTNDGQVRIWRGGSGSDFQYQHSGPLLELLCIPKHNLIGSVGKDGQVILYDMTKRQVVFSQQFPKADYQLVLSDDEAHLIAAPAVGFPMAINLATLKSSKVRHTLTNLTTKVEFGTSRAKCLSPINLSPRLLGNLLISQLQRKPILPPF